MRRIQGWRLGAVVLAAGLGACSAPKIDESQVIARVNKDELSVHQFDFALNKQLPRKLDEDERRALLDRMVDRQLAVQAALAGELDRRADVMMRLEEARRDILAAAYAEDVAGRQGAPDNEAVARYFAEHPGLFAERRIYRLRETVLPLDSSAIVEARQRLAAREETASVLAWLRARQPRPFAEQNVMRPAEQLPIEIADRMARVQRGDTIAFDTPRGLVIYEVQSFESAPMPWQEAQPVIRRHLKNQAEGRAVEAELAKLRAAARIEKKTPLLKPAS